MFETPPELPAMLPHNMVSKPLFIHVCQQNTRQQTVSKQALTEEMAIKMFFVLTKVPIFSKICGWNKKATAKMVLIVMKADFF